MASREKSHQQRLEALARDIESLERFEPELNQQIVQARQWIIRTEKLGNSELLARWIAYEKGLLEQRERLEVIRGLVHQLLSPEVH